MKRFGLPVVVILLIFTVISFGQSLAEIAKRERERQKTAKTKVVVTNNESSAAAPAPAQIPPTAPATTQAESSAAAKPTGPTDNQGHDEKYWRAAFQKARDDVQRTQGRLQLLDLKIKQINTDMMQYSNFYNRENRLGADLTAAQSELATAQKDAAQAQQRLSDLEEELRKAGGLAGWAR